MDDPFKYIPPDETKERSFHDVANAISEAYRVVLDACPESRERSLAVTKLQEARMWANAAISFDGRKIKQ